MASDRTPEQLEFRTRYEDHRTKVETPRGYSLSLIDCPLPENPRGVAIFLHGYGDYGDHNTVAEDLISHGIACCSFDEYGHGKSDGVFGYVPDFENMVHDAAFVFKRYIEQNNLQHLRKFVVGESMGGAIATLMSLLYPDLMDGVILVAPMVKVAEKMTPPWIVQVVARGLAKVIPTAPIVPGPDLLALCNKDPSFNEESYENPLTYTPRKPRLKTAFQMLEATERIERQLGDVSRPILIMHGDADQVTDPNVSKLLYEKARSEDKTLELFEGMWHSLWNEPDGGRERVLQTMYDWIDARC